MLPVSVLIGILVYLLLLFLHMPLFATIVILLAVFVGSFDLFKEVLISLLHKQYALDYIAVLAILTSLLTNEYLVASVIALMITSGRTLEAYGVSQAKKSLTKLIDRIPNEVVLWENGKGSKKEKITNVKVGQEILIRKGEVIALDGILLSEAGLTDESSLTGEPYMIDKIQGDHIRSGTVNAGNPIAIKVTKTEKDSTYKKIVDMVKKAQSEKAPLVRLADSYSTFFTIVTLFIAGFAYFYSHNLVAVLAVLVIATPCPLILATPIALLGGVNASAKKRIIVKKLASIEALARTKTLIFDKTGTITIGRPKVVDVTIQSKAYDRKTLFAVAEAIERNSLHPLAKAIVVFAKEQETPIFHAEQIVEKIGAGITGVVNKKSYQLSKVKEQDGMAIELLENGRKLAVFHFEDEIKPESKQIITHLRNLGFELSIFTGDKKAAAERIAKTLGGQVTVKAECTPEDKQKGIAELQKQGKTTAMVGDGINDAPALALADVGLVFSNDEQTAASEAADIVFLGGDFSLVYQAIAIARQTIAIAMQSITWGIGASILGMILASFGLIPPLAGAILQEGIDVAVILNALRASR